MKKNILLRTNLLVCLVIVTGFLVTAVLSYRANYDASLLNIEQVSDLTSEGIYYQITSTFTKPVNISLTMANDSLLKELLSREAENLDSPVYTGKIREYLDAYKEKYGYDSVFLASAATSRYYHFNGLDRVLKKGDPENDWYYDFLEGGLDCAINVDNDEVVGAENEITVFVNCKIHDDAGQVIGAVGVGVRIGSLQQLLQGYRDEFGVNAYLIGADGKIEISPEHSGYEHVNLFETGGYDEAMKERILGWQEGAAYSFWTGTRDAPGRRTYVVTRYVPELSWRLVVERDTGETLAGLNRQLIVTIAVITGILFCTLIVITNVIHYLNRQLMTLARVSEEERRTLFERATEQLYENIYELDVTHNKTANRATEEYFESLGAPPGTPFDKALQIYAEKQIKAEFRQGYIDTFSPENVLRAYEEGRDTLSYEFMVSTDGSTYYWMRITAQLIRRESDASLHMLTYRQNIDAEKRREKRMQELAQTDEMTGMLNKTATRRRIDRLLTEGGLWALFIFDIDGFKQANDQHGHAFGDSVIQSFTGRIRTGFREAAALGRIGGDEFAACVQAADKSWAAAKAGELTRELNYTHSADGREWHVSTSIGVAFASSGDSFDSLFKRADEALYETKKHGKNGYTIAP